MKSYNILGSGYTGPYLRDWILSREPGSVVRESSRTNSKTYCFDLNEESTWKNIPKADFSFVLFPLSEPSIARRFFEMNRDHLGKTVICSSTGFFKTEFEHQKINEESPVDLTQARPTAEEALRKEGAIVVHASGIYGPGRNPLNWLLEGRVRPSEKYVNLIHVEDLAQYLFQASLKSKPGDRWIASDGRPMRWKTLSETWEKEFGFEFETMGDSSASKRASKQVDCSKSMAELEVLLRYPSVLEGVRKLQRA